MLIIDDLSLRIAGRLLLDHTSLTLPAGSKAGLVGLTKTVAKELAGRKITVNAVAPGFIASDMTAALGSALLDEVKKRVPAKRLGEAWEIAEAVLFLAAPSSGYITAQTLVVDGGLIG